MRDTTLGHILGGGGFNGNGIALTDCTIGSTVFGMAFNGDTLFLGNPLGNTIYATVDQSGVYAWAAQGTIAAGTLIANNNVGIGTSTPQAALDVNGSADFERMTTINGGMALSGTAVTSGTTTTIVATPGNLLLIPQQGDLSMGSFTNGAQPPLSGNNGGGGDDDAVGAFGGFSGGGAAAATGTNGH